MHDKCTINARFLFPRSKGKVKTFTICWYDWDESGTKRELARWSELSTLAPWFI